MKKIIFPIIILLLMGVIACNNSENQNADSDSWITVNEQGNLTLFGNPVQDFEALEASLYDTLSKMQTLPTTIPVDYNDKILMGTKAEIESIISATLATATARQECETVIHNFYAWYEAFQQSGKNINFTKDDGKHLKLDAAKLTAYLDNFKASGFVSDKLIESQKTFYQECEVLWQEEDSDGVPSGLDADVYFCAQDWDINFWTKSPVFIDLEGDNISAAMRGMEGGSPREQNFKLVKENGKWLIAKIECAVN